ncbi:GIY-YIG nuclease family protein [Candidatus Woesebacteria bacterium]|nr:GIY-YIG nuclease family protein [Candidatus Woesebacteria bacterium]
MEEATNKTRCIENDKANGGVYKITNKINGRFYIGSSKTIKNRWLDHRKRLLDGTHKNKFLQNDFNKLGKTLDNFIFEVIAYEDDKIKRFDIEQKYITMFHDGCKNCYNIEKTSTPLSDRVFSKTAEETRKKISDKLKEFYKTDKGKEIMKELAVKGHAKESIEKRSKSLKESLKSPDVRKNYSDAAKKRFEESRIKSEDGIAVKPEVRSKISEGLKKYFKENSEKTGRKIKPYSQETLERKSKAMLKCCEDAKMIQKLSEANKESWSKTRESRISAHIKSGRIKPFYLKSQNGEIFYIEIITKWCSERGLAEDGIRSVRDKKRSSYKGYSLYEKVEESLTVYEDNENLSNKNITTFNDNLQKSATAEPMQEPCQEKVTVPVDCV